MAVKPIIRGMVYRKYNGHCGYCGQEITLKTMQIDHIIPRCIGHFLKSDVMKNSLKTNIKNIDEFENLMPSCRRCNHYKRAYKLEDYRRLLKSLHERIQKNYINKVGVDYGIITIKPFDGMFYFERER